MKDHRLSSSPGFYIFGDSKHLYSKVRNWCGQRLRMLLNATSSLPLVVWKIYMKEPSSGRSTLTFPWSSPSLSCLSLYWWEVCSTTPPSLLNRSVATIDIYIDEILSLLLSLSTSRISLIPQDLELWISSFGDAGFIIVTLGSMVSSISVGPLLTELVAGFSTIPQGVLWR